jgi:squalene cyclase
VWGVVADGVAGIARMRLFANVLTGLTLVGKQESNCSLALRLLDDVKQISQPDVNWVGSCRWQKGHALVHRG